MHSNVGIGMIGPHPDQLVKEFDFKTTDLIDPVAKVEVRLAKYGANGSEKVFCSQNAYNFASQQTMINFTYPDQAEKIPNGFVEGSCSG